MTLRLPIRNKGVDGLLQPVQNRDVSKAFMVAAKQLHVHLFVVF